MSEGADGIALICQNLTARQINTELNPFLAKSMDDGAIFEASKFPTCHPLDWDSPESELLESGEEWQAGTGVIVREWEVGGFKCLKIAKKWKNRNRLRNPFTINDQCRHHTQNKAST